MKTTWPIYGHQKHVSLLDRALRQDRLAHAYLFYGPRGTGKKYLAELLVKNAQQTEVPLPPAQLVSLPREAETEISVDDIRQAILFLKMSAVEKKFLLITRVEVLSQEAYNALLKTIEEPPKNSYIIMIAESLNKIPATVISRSQLLKLVPLSEEDMKQWAAATVGSDVAETVMPIATGRPGRAMRLLEDEMAGYRMRFTRILALLGRKTGSSFEEIKAHLDANKTQVDASAQDALRETAIDLDYLESAIRDIIFLALGEPNWLINKLFRDQLTALTTLWTTQELLTAIGHIRKFREALTPGVNLQLAWEKFLIALSSTYE